MCHIRHFIKRTEFLGIKCIDGTCREVRYHAVLTNFRIDRLSNAGASFNNHRPTFEFDFFSLAGMGILRPDLAVWSGLLGLDPSHFGPSHNLIVYILTPNRLISDGWEQGRCRWNRSFLRFHSFFILPRPHQCLSCDDSNQWNANKKKIEFNVSVDLDELMFLVSIINQYM